MTITRVGAGNGPYSLTLVLNLAPPFSAGFAPPLTPVFVGDTIYAESTVLSKRESKSRPTQGIVTVRTVGLKADGKEFMSFERTVLVPKRGAGIEI